MKRRQLRLNLQNLSSARGIFLLLWAIGSIPWVTYWAIYFYSNCDLGETLVCVFPGVLWIATYSLPAVLIKVLAIPAVPLIAGLAMIWPAGPSRNRRLLRILLKPLSVLGFFVTFARPSATP